MRAILLLGCLLILSGCVGLGGPDPKQVAYASEWVSSSREYLTECENKKIAAYANTRDSASDVATAVMASCFEAVDDGYNALSYQCKLNHFSDGGFRGCDRGLSGYQAGIRSEIIGAVVEQRAQKIKPKTP